MRPPLLVLLGALAACATPPRERPGPGGGPVLPFVENDYPGALARARAEGKPLFVDVWAPW